MLRTKDLVFRGHVAASGMLFDFELVSVDEVHRRVLSMWRTGMNLYEIDFGMVVQFGSPIDVRDSSCFGLPLVLTSGRLVGLPLDSLTLLKLSPAPNSVLVARHGEVVQLVLQGQIDPAKWLDVDDFKLLDVNPLGQPEVLKLEPPPGVDRSAFGVGALAPESSKILQQLGRSDSQKNAADDSSGEAGQGLEELKELWQSLIAWFRKGIERSSGGSAQGPTSSAQPSSAFANSALLRSLTGAFRQLLSSLARLQSQQRRPEEPQNNAAPAQPKQTDDMAWRIKLLFMQLLGSLGILSVVQAQQARFFNKLLDLLSQGDWSEALRYAIPLAADGEGSPEPFLKMLSLRNSFSLSLTPTAPTSSLGLEQSMLDHLKQLYRRAFEQLDAAGRVDEAAFVLAELLQAYEEAVSYLERHGRFKLAAQVSEARNLTPALTVRLWLLAGDSARAVSVARVRQCFEAAVTMLERRKSPLAAALRTHWAHSLAESGDYASAIFVVWHLPEYRGLTNAWLKLALEAQGASSGQLLARYLLRMPESVSQIEQEIDMLLKDRSMETAYTRLDFLNTLVEAGPVKDAVVQDKARDAVRAMLRDAADGSITVTKSGLKEVTRATDDRTLWADLSSIQLPDSQPSFGIVKGPSRIDITGQGVREMFDAAWLPNGNCILAFGEAGVDVVNAQGRVVRHYSVPAYEFVVSWHGDRVIAVARRGEARRLTRIDVLRHEQVDLGEPRIVSFSKDFDGSTWVVYGDAGLVLVDTLATKCKPIVKLPNVEGDVLAISSHGKSCAFITRTCTTRDSLGRSIEPVVKYERWSCDATDLQLRERVPVTMARDGCVVSVVNDAGGTFVVREAAPNNEPWLPYLEIFRNDSRFGIYSLLAQGARLTDVEISMRSQWIAMAIPVTGGVDCHIRKVFDEEVGKTFFLEGAKHARVRVGEQHVTMCDDRGRLVVVELRFGKVVRNLCL